MAAGLLVPATIAAQAAPLPSTGGILVTPFVGWATGTTRNEVWTYPDGSGATVRDEVAMNLAGGLALGAVLQLPVRGAFSLLGGVTWIDRDDASFSIGGGEAWVFTGSTSLLAKAGFGLQLGAADDAMAVRRLRAGMFLAPFYMIEKPREIPGIDDSGLFDTASHFGVNLGLTGELPFAGDRLALQVGVDDYLTFYRTDPLRRLPDWLHAAPGTTVEVDATHQWLVRAGISLRLH